MGRRRRIVPSESREILRWHTEKGLQGIENVYNQGMSESVEQEFEEFRELVASYMSCIAFVPMRACDVDQAEEEELAGAIFRYLKFYDGEEEDQ